MVLYIGIKKIKKTLDTYWFFTVYLDMKIKGNNMILLDSVGTFLDTDNGITYPAEVNDSGFTRTFTPDLDSPYPLADIKEDEWVLSLSKTDFDVVANYLSNN